MPAAMLSSEVIEDGQGGGFVLQVYPKRTDIIRRTPLGEIKAAGSAFGPESVEVARLWARALVDKAALVPSTQ